MIETDAKIKKTTHHQKLLNIYRTAYTSPLPTNDTYFELFGQDLYVPTHIGLICGYYQPYAHKLQRKCFCEKVGKKEKEPINLPKRHFFLYQNRFYLNLGKIVKPKA